MFALVPSVLQISTGGRTEREKEKRGSSEELRNKQTNKKEERKRERDE